MFNVSRISACLLTFAIVACGGGSDAATGSNGSGNNDYSNVPPPPGGVAQFTVSPIDLASDSLGTLTPLGNLAPPGHVLPTNHVYFYAVDFDHPPAVPDSTVRPVYMPATGAVTFMLQSGGDWKLEFRATENFFFYFGHIHPIAGVAVGTVYHAGDQIGTTGPGVTLDLGAFDLGTTLPGFANPARYGAETLHCVVPWEYFVEPLKSQIYARLRRSHSAPSMDARIDFDVPGRLVGNWYDQSLTPNDQTESPTGWPLTLAFVYDYYDPSLVRVSIGGTIATPGVWTIPADAPRPETVSVASGLVIYSLRYTGSTDYQSGVMLVQMLDDHTIKVEVFEGNQASATAFDANARTYVR